MSAALQIHLVRRGETPWSLSGQHTGLTDLSLTAPGQAQAGLDADAILEPDLAGGTMAMARGCARQTLRRCAPAGTSGAMACLQGRVALFSHGQFGGSAGGALAARWRRAGGALDGLVSAGLCWPGSTLKLHPASLDKLGYAAHPPQTRLVGLWTEVPMVPARG